MVPYMALRWFLYGSYIFLCCFYIIHVWFFHDFYLVHPSYIVSIWLLRGSLLILLMYMVIEWLMYSSYMVRHCFLLVSKNSIWIKCQFLTRKHCLYSALTFRIYGNVAPDRYFSQRFGCREIKPNFSMIEGKNDCKNVEKYSSEKP